MSKVFSALAVSVDGYITGRNREPGHGLGNAAADMTGRQTLVTTGIADAVAAARAVAGDKDVALMGGGVVTQALSAGLVDELILHQVPILLYEVAR